MTRQPNLKDMAASISIDIQIDDMQNEIIFETEQLGTDSVLAWAETALCPLNKARYRKAGVNARGKPVKGRRDFACMLSREEEQQQGGANKALAASQIYWVPGKNPPPPGKNVVFHYIGNSKINLAQQGF